MEKDLKDSIGQVTKLTESVSIMQIGEKNYRINSLPIGRVKDLMIKLNSLFQMIQQKATKENLDFDSDNLEGMILLFSDILFPAITDIINLIFRVRNNDFKDFTQEFVENNFGIPEIKSICMLLVEQNGLSNLLPFFQKSFQEIFRNVLSKEVETAVKKTKKKKV